MDRAEAEQLVKRSVHVAREARDRMGGDGSARWVAASVGPYGAVVADGSEYRGHYGISRAALRDLTGPGLELLASAGPDFFAVETIPDIAEAEVLVQLLDDLDAPRGSPSRLGACTPGPGSRLPRPSPWPHPLAACSRSG